MSRAGHNKVINMKVLRVENMNPHVVRMEHSIRGPIYNRALEIEKEMKQGELKPFTHLIKCHLGDGHACGQQPITFVRQVVALCAYPKLLENIDFPNDAKERAQRILDGCRGQSIGSYTDHVGLLEVREDCSRYISRRDGGIPCQSDDIFLSTGASHCIRSVLKVLMTGRDRAQAGIMIPVPQHPLYMAIAIEYNAIAIPYNLNEEQNWHLDIAELKRAIDAERYNCIPKAIVVINPGNPTGQVLDEDNIQTIIRFAAQEKLLILADEVYQHNVYGKEFVSFKKVLKGMGAKYTKMELASFWSASKGFISENGMRSGFCEIINLDPYVKEELNKLLSAKLCSNVLGQAAISAVTNAPKPGESSYEQYQLETGKILRESQEKADIVVKTLNTIEGVVCNEIFGSMYAFPRIYIPQKAIHEAAFKKLLPDAMYCAQLLEEAGVVVTPGSGFGQNPDTFHFRMTLYPPMEELQLMLERFREFNRKFLMKYK